MRYTHYEGVGPVERIKLMRAYRDLDEADAEAARLNSVRRSDRVEYFVEILAAPKRTPASGRAPTSRPGRARLPGREQSTRASEPIARWVDEAIAQAHAGAVCEENLWALLGTELPAALAWEHARAGYRHLLARLMASGDGLVGKLIVPLKESDAVTTPAPPVDHVEREFDTVYPPRLVVHPQLFRRDWAPYAEYRHPYESDVFCDADGRALAQGLYIVFRDEWEVRDDSPYRRDLLFERVEAAGPGGA